MSDRLERFYRFVEVGNFTKDERDSKFLAAMGLAGEAGEVCDMLKKHLLHNAPLDQEAFVKELGDVFWYLIHACNAFDVQFEEVIETNIRKLCDRYPDQYGDPEEWIHGAFVEFSEAGGGAQEHSEVMNHRF